MGQAMASRFTGLSAGQARGALVGAAAAVVCVVAIGLALSGVASGEVAATLLFLPVFAAGLLGGRRAGYLAAGVAAVVYVALRRDDLSSAAAASAGVLTLTRAGAYVVAGHIGGLAQALASGAAGDAAGPDVSSRRLPAAAGRRGGAAAPERRAQPSGWDQVWEAGEPVYAGAARREQPVLAGVGPSAVGGGSYSAYEGGNGVHTNTTMSGAWPPEPPDEQWSDRGGRDLSRGRDGRDGRDDVPWGDDGWPEAGAGQGGAGAWPAGGGGRPVTDDSWEAVQQSWRQQHGVPLDDGPVDDRTMQHGAGSWGPAQPPDQWPAPAGAPAAADAWGAPQGDPWGTPQPAVGDQWSEQGPAGWPDGPAGPVASASPGTTGWPATQPDDPWGDSAPTGGTWPPPGPADHAGAGGAWPSPDAPATDPGWPASGATGEATWPSQPPSSGEPAWPAQDGPAGESGWPAEEQPGSRHGWPGHESPGTETGWPAQGAQEGTWPSPAGAGEPGGGWPAGPAGAAPEGAWAPPAGGQWAAPATGEQGWGDLAGDAWPTESGRTDAVWDQPAGYHEPTGYDQPASYDQPTGYDQPAGYDQPTGYDQRAGYAPQAGYDQSQAQWQQQSPQPPPAPLPAVDPETGLWTVKFLRDRLSTEQARSRRTGHPFSLVLVQVPDGPLAQLPYRRQVTLLRELGYQFVAGGVVDHLVHVPDQAQHWFAVILPDTDRSGAQVLERRLRLGIGGYLSSRGLRLRDLESASLTAPDDDPAMGAIWDALIGPGEPG
jgi:hypothetical protein